VKRWVVLTGLCLLGAAPAPRGAAVEGTLVPGGIGSGRVAASSPAAEGTFVPRAAGAGTAGAGTPAGAVPPSRDEAGRPRFAWPKLQVLEHIEANEIVEAAGVPVALRAVHVKERLQEAVQRFADAFTKGGLHVPPGPEQPQLARGAVMLTAVDMDRRITYTAILQPQEDGTTMAYLGEANHMLRRPPVAAGDFAPLPPGASQVLRVGGESSRTMAFHVPLSGGDVEAFYTQALPQHGWRPLAEAPGVYTRRGEELQLIHEPGAGGQQAVVLVYRGSAAPPPPKAATPAPP
jgi:hypothetical protein